MRIRDDTAEGISSFYAELLRIKRIIEASRFEPPLLFLIDELLKGTNSDDRIMGAEAVVKNLSTQEAIGFISTHDFQLCELENAVNGILTNCHFTEQYADDRITFDYKLLPGRCTSTNARQLMKMMGLISE